MSSVFPAIFFAPSSVIAAFFNFWVATMNMNSSGNLPYYHQTSFPTEQGMAMKRSSVDCHAIGQSLKRFKISTSPGELRLDRDIECLLAGKRWTSMVHHSQCCGDVTNDRRGGGRIHGEIYSRDAHLVRDPVDPLQLRLSCLLHSRNNSHPLSSLHAPPVERWTFCICMPRMYPHAPPTITRVTRDIVPNNENMACLGNVNNLDYHTNSNSASAAILASSAMQHHNMEPPVPEQVLIQLLPPTSNHSDLSSGNGSAHGVAKNYWDIDLATAVCNSWTPVSTLQDLIDFLMEIPARRWEWWSKESNRRHHLQQQWYYNS
jgi:hypothetical protein